VWSLEDFAIARPPPPVLSPLPPRDLPEAMIEGPPSLPPLQRAWVAPVSQRPAPSVFCAVLASIVLCLFHFRH
jgi:hypothetical protein